MKTTIKFYTGLDTIGALVMEIRYGKDRVLLEAGTAFNPEFNIFDGTVIKRDNIIKDYLWTGEIPTIDGIYDAKYLKGSNLLSQEESNLNTAVFVSHLHLDHMRMMGLISNNIPVYLTSPAIQIEKALEEVGLGIDTVRDNYQEMKEDTMVGSIKVHRFILNDFSYQDLSFFVETPDLKLHYTGDIFAFGAYYDGLQKEIEYLNQKDVDLIVHEGTTFSWMKEDYQPVIDWNQPNLISEKEKDERIIKFIQEYPSLVVVNYYEREMIDVKALFEYAKQSGRTIVFEPKSAHIINTYFKKPVSIILSDNNETIPHLNEIIQYNQIVDQKEILENPSKYIVQNTYPNMLELLDYRHLNALYLHTSGSPIGSFDPCFANMLRVVEKANMNYWRPDHFEDGTYFSQHATPGQVLKYLSQVNYKLAIPTHTGNRKLIMKHEPKDAYYVETGKTYVYDKEHNTLKEEENESN